MARLLVGLPQLPQNVLVGVVAVWLAFLKFGGASLWPVVGLMRGHERLLRLLRLLRPGSVLGAPFVCARDFALPCWVGCMVLGVVAGGFAAVAAAPWSDLVAPCRFALGFSAS